jgi:hypothetical protein
MSSHKRRLAAARKAAQKANFAAKKNTNAATKGHLQAPTEPSKSKPKPFPTSPRRPLRQQRWFRIVEWAFGAVVLVVGLLASAYQLGGGPPWPAAPEIDPGAPAYSAPFSIPFQVQNPSSLFWMHRPIFECMMASIRFSDGTFVENLDTQVAHLLGDLLDIAPKGTHPFKCWFPNIFSKGGVVVDAKLNIMASWKIRFLGLEFSSWEPTIGPFHWDNTLNPPRWIKGEPLPSSPLPPPRRLNR